MSAEYTSAQGRSEKSRFDILSCDIGIYTYDAAGKAARHQCEADEEEQPRSPDCSRVAEAFVSAYAVFIDQVDHQHSEKGADARYPIDEGDMDWGRNLRIIVRRMGMCGQNSRVQECPVG